MAQSIEHAPKYLESIKEACTSLSESPILRLLNLRLAWVEIQILIRLLALDAREPYHGEHDEYHGACDTKRVPC